MLKLYAVPISLYCAKIRIVLRQKKLEWEEVLPPGGYGSEEYNKIVPAGNLPALMHDDLLLGDSEAIAEYLNEVFCEPKMLPGNAQERAKLRERSRFHDTRLEPAIRALFPHIATKKRNDAFVENQWLEIRKRVAQLERLLPATQNSLTLGDCGYAITCLWISELSLHFELPPLFSGEVTNYLERLSEFHAVSAELAEYRPRLINWLSTQ